VIFEAIAAVKVANEAIGAIKEFAGHIQSVGELGKPLSQLADAKEEIQKKAEQGDMQAFFELEKIRQREEEIRTMFIYSGRAGLWDDYQKFIANRKQLKENERKRIAAAKARKKKLIKEWTLGIAVTVAALSAVGLCAYFLYWLITNKGS
jgi:hypothetical protein